MNKDPRSKLLLHGCRTVSLACSLILSSGAAEADQPQKRNLTLKHKQKEAGASLTKVTRIISAPKLDSGSLPRPRLSTTLNIDGIPARVKLFGSEYLGVQLTHVGVEGMAASAGLRAGDVLLSLNGHNVSSAESADDILNKLPSGDLNFAFFRKQNGKLLIDESRIRFVNPLKQYGSDTYIHQTSPY